VLLGLHNLCYEVTGFCLCRGKNSAASYTLARSISLSNVLLPLIGGVVVILPHFDCLLVVVVKRANGMILCWVCGFSKLDLNTMSFKRL